MAVVVGLGGTVVVTGGAVVGGTVVGATVVATGVGGRVVVVAERTVVVVVEVVVVTGARVVVVGRTVVVVVDVTRGFASSLTGRSSHPMATPTPTADMKIAASKVANTLVRFISHISARTRRP